MKNIVLKLRTVNDRTIYIRVDQSINDTVVDAITTMKINGTDPVTDRKMVIITSSIVSVEEANDDELSKIYKNTI